MQVPVGSCITGRTQVQSRVAHRELHARAARSNIRSWLDAELCAGAQFAYRVARREVASRVARREVASRQVASWVSWVAHTDAGSHAERLHKRGGQMQDVPHGEKR